MAVIAAASPWGDYNDYTSRRCASIRSAARHRHPASRQSNARVDDDEADGVVGVRLPFVSMKEVPDVTTPDYRRFFRRLADLDWHVHPHIECEKLPLILPARSLRGQDRDRPYRPAGPRDRYQQRGLQGDAALDRKGPHLGKAVGGPTGSVRTPPTARGTGKHAGPDRLIWASDCPFVGEESTSPISRPSTG